jgi:hypothetical protein
MVETRPIGVTAGKAARNERRKAVATTCNAMSVALVISIIIQPLNTGRIGVTSTLLALNAFIVFQGLLHYLLGRVED